MILSENLYFVTRDRDPGQEEDGFATESFVVREFYIRARDRVFLARPGHSIVHCSPIYYMRSRVSDI